MALTFDNSAPRRRSMPSRRCWPAATSSCVPATELADLPLPDLGRRVRQRHRRPALPTAVSTTIGRHHANAGTINNFKLPTPGNGDHLRFRWHFRRRPERHQQRDPFRRHVGVVPGGLTLSLQLS